MVKRIRTIYFVGLEAVLVHSLAAIAGILLAGYQNQLWYAFSAYSAYQAFVLGRATIAMVRFERERAAQTRQVFDNLLKNLVREQEGAHLPAASIN